MSGPRIIHPFDPHRPVQKDELAYNCTRWAITAKEELRIQGLDRKIGFIFVFLQKGQLGQGVGVVASNLMDRAVRGELEAMVRRPGDQRRIIIPGEEG